MKKVIGVDIGGTKCAVILGETDGKTINIINKTTFATNVNEGPVQAICHIMAEIEKAADSSMADGRRISKIGITCGGPLDIEKGIIQSPPNLTGWHDIHIVKVLQEKFSIKAELQNDANACALAEWKFGAGSGTQNMIFLTFGTGMGAGIVLNGRLYSGSCGMAGEIGHVRIAGDGPVGYGKSGSFEGFCSGGGIVQIARTKIYEKIQLGEPISFCSNIRDIDSLNAKIIGDAAEAGDPLAIEIYGICGRHLGQGLSILIDILNPEVIVIGSIFARSRELLWPSAKEVIECEALPRSAGACRIVPAKLGENIGDIAALSVAL